jgi:4-hydroxybenzoate polyprenyltransferase
MRWLHFILSHSIFIAICAVALCFQTSLLLHINVSLQLYTFIFFSTVCSYNFYWLLSGYSFTGGSLKLFLKHHYTNWGVFLIAAAALLFTLLKIPELLPVCSVALLLTLLYAVPLLPFKIVRFTRKAGLLKTFLLAFTWAFVTVYIPYHQAQTVNAVALGMLFNNRFIFMLILCIIFDARDTNVDKIRGLQSLTTLLKPSTVKYLMAVCFIIYILNGIIFRVYYNQQVQIIPLLVTGAATVVVYFFAQKKQDYFFYYFLVDGLMLFSAITAYVASI